jgi:Spy/CpxP family protein refolding chaperone
MSRISRFSDPRAALAAAMVALAISAQPVLAQGGGGGGGGAQRMQAALFQGITLTPAQKSKVDSIAGAYRANNAGVTPGPDMSPADRQKMRDSRQHEIADLRSVLTSDQQPTFDQNVTQIRSSMRSRGGMRDSTAGGPPQ